MALGGGEDNMFSTFIGTPVYMAPEVLLRAEDGYMFESDMWSLGSLVFELCSGRCARQP